MENILSYVRGLLSGTYFSRKRRAVDDCENPTSSKVRRISISQMSLPEDDWFSTASSSSFRRRSGLLPKPDTKQCSWLRNNGPITLDDDEDDIIEIKKPDFDFSRRSFKQTSTPNCSGSKLQNGDDDVIFVKSTISPAEKKHIARKKGFDYIKSPAAVSDLQNGTTNKIQNGTRKKEYSPLFKSVKDFKKSSNLQFPPPRKAIRSPGLEHSFRLEDKRRYEQLLNKGQSSMKNLFIDSYNDFKSFKFQSMGFRGKKMVDMATGRDNKKVSDIIDLTENGKSKSSGKRSTLERIQKVLREHDNDVVVLKDSDSDADNFPNPPSPKPDFKIEKINSLKTFAHSSEPTHGEWITLEIKRHDDAIQKRQKLIEEQKQSLEKFKNINGELRVNLLNEKVKECLHIKDTLLPVYIPKEDPFKDLTPQQNSLVDKAFNRRMSGTEVLVSKFNINITRTDLLTLSGLNWLNDEVINFYMNLIIERGKSQKFPSVHSMNTFFYPKVLNSGQSSVKRWTKRIDLFLYDMVTVPIHLGVHWCMAIIDFRKKTITYYDSMGSSNNVCLNTLLQYLVDEHIDKKKTAIDVSDWRLINADRIPQQMNGSDCGMFSITFAEFLTRDADISFSQENMPYIRRKVCAEILEGKLFIS